MIQTRLEILPEILRVLCSCLRSNKDFIPSSCKSKPDLMLTVRIPSRRIEKCDPVLIRFAKQINGSIIRNSLNRQCTESVLVRYDSCFTKSYCFHIGTPFYNLLCHPFLSVSSGLCSKSRTRV